MQQSADFNNTSVLSFSLVIFIIGIVPVTPRTLTMYPKDNNIVYSKMLHCSILMCKPF